MRLVAIDTSTPWCGIALVAVEGGLSRVVAEAGFRLTDSSHADRLLERVEALVMLAGWSKRDLGCVVATRGPGSFTGIRVALGTARGLALASGNRAVGVGTLEALAEAHGPAERARLAVMDAGRGEIVAALFDPAGSPPLPLSPSRRGRPSEERRSAEPPRLIVPAPGSEELAALTARDADRVAAAPRSIASAAARIAVRSRLFDDPAGGDLSPIYVRPPDAELARDAHERDDAD